MDVKMEASWKAHLASEFEKPYFSTLVDFVKRDYSTHVIYPKGNQIFNAFDKTPFDQVKVVILGQDPYHEPGQANGLCFSVNDGIPLPPSLQNIYKELQDDLGITPAASGNLARWAEQGVLLLNATLTVQAHQAGSHQNKGWEEFTDAVIHALAEQKEHIVYILWGSYAQRKGAFINPAKNRILKSAHPSPLSAYRGFFGSKPFSAANAYLVQQGGSPINW
ncbi:MAG: Uracil-DNA glycosylase [Candidatus Ordinivivax streblomastigis]|uniref:Uracil-DNA glycosylase n=1 Tax=Candidatus Ordinivivax streblomastigis TaxID=2540710 RepID=A0A5M8P020_9BACT|nr:MAG: Uracil-DNA glycosylase [Candidatus Ordinivivax streblomastigis]